MTGEMNTGDLRAELQRREEARKKRGHGVKKHGVSVGALLIAALGAYESYANKEVATLAATVAAEAKVDSNKDRADLVEAINELKQEKAVLTAQLEAERKLNEERYGQLREWLRSISSRSTSVPEAITRTIEPPAPRPKPVEKLSKERSSDFSGDYQQQVQQVLMEKGFK